MGAFHSYCYPSCLLHRFCLCHRTGICGYDEHVTVMSLFLPIHREVNTETETVGDACHLSCSGDIIGNDDHSSHFLFFR